MKNYHEVFFAFFSALFEFSLEILWIAVFCRNNTIFFINLVLFYQSFFHVILPCLRSIGIMNNRELSVHHYLYFVWRFDNMSMTSVWRRNKKLGKVIASLCQAATLRKPCFWIEINNFRKGIIHHYTETFLFKSLLLLTNKTKSLLCK